MYLKLPSELRNLSGYPDHNPDLTPELSELLLANYCPSCSKKTDCKIKKGLEKSVTNEEAFQNPSLVMLYEEIDVTVMDFYVEDEITKREDGYYETSDGMIFTPITHDDIPVFPVCLEYQNQQRNLPGLESEYLDFVHPLVKNLSFRI